MFKMLVVCIVAAIMFQLPLRGNADCCHSYSLEVPDILGNKQSYKACDDCTAGTPYCSRTGTCNIFGCNCDGGCRVGDCSKYGVMNKNNNNKNNNDNNASKTNWSFGPLSGYSSSSSTSHSSPGIKGWNDDSWPGSNHGVGQDNQDSFNSMGSGKNHKGGGDMVQKLVSGGMKMLGGSIQKKIKTSIRDKNYGKRTTRIETAHDVIRAADKDMDGMMSLGEAHAHLAIEGFPAERLARSLAVLDVDKDNFLSAHEVDTNTH